METILVGCEVICIGEQKTDLTACPLSKEEQAGCQMRRQYQAGEKEVFRKLRQASHGQPIVFDWALDENEIQWIYEFGRRH